MNLSKQPYRGCRDLFPAQKRVHHFLFDQMRKSAELFGYEPYDGPLLEPVELYLAKSGEELINEQIYSFVDRGDRKVAIRPEMTPTLARMVAQIHRETPKPIRWYAIPNLMRYEKPQKGRLREHWQYNCDIFGAEVGDGELEIISLIVSFLNSFKADTNHFEVCLNDRKIVDYIFANKMNLTNEVSYKLYKIVDKAKKVSTEALDKMLDTLALNLEQIKIFKNYIGLNDFSSLEAFLKTLGTDYPTDFFTFIKNAKEAGLSEYLTYDPAIVRGLDYYTGLVFEVFDKHPDNRRALCGGGAYSSLLKIFNEQPVHGVGFGMGDVTLNDFLEVHKLLPDFSKASTTLAISYQTEVAKAAAYQLASKMRSLDISTEFFFGISKPKKVFETTEKKGHNFVIFIGEDELNNKKFQVKNLKTKDAISLDFNFKAEDILKFIRG